MIALALAALLAQSATGQVTLVPSSSHAVLVDARCDADEWRHASRTPLTGGAELLLQQDASSVYLCVPLPADSYRTMDLYVSSGATSLPFNLHASAQVGERQRTTSGWPEWAFGNQRDWYSPPVALSRAEVSDNRPRLTFGAIHSREVAIRKSKFGPGPWRIMLDIRALGAAKDGTLRYPAAASVDDPATWASLQVAVPASVAPAGAIVLSIDSKALGERRELWIDAPAGCTASAACDTLFVLDAHALFPIATSYASVMQAMGGLRPIIIVGIPSLSMDDRIRNFTRSVSAADRARYPGAGGAGQFADFLHQDVVPAIAARFTTGPAQILAGHSLAGLFAVETLAAGHFSGAIAISPTLGWHDGAAHALIERWLKAPSAPRRLYASVADGDTQIYRDHFTRMDTRVTTIAPAWLQSSFMRRANEDHVTTVAPALQQAMLSFFAK